MPDDKANCPIGVENKVRIVSLERRINVVEEAIVQIRDTLLGRPSWLVLFAMTGMSSAIVGLLIKLATMGQ